MKVGQETVSLDPLFGTKRGSSSLDITDPTNKFVFDLGIAFREHLS